MNAARPWRGASANDLSADPELSAIAMLDAVLAVTLEALPAFVPELDPRARTWSDAPPDVLAARQIVVHGLHLRALIADYRREIDRRLDDDIPF